MVPTLGKAGADGSEFRSRLGMQLCVMGWLDDVIRWGLVGIQELIFEVPGGFTQVFHGLPDGSRDGGETFAAEEQKDGGKDHQ